MVDKLIISIPLLLRSDSLTRSSVPLGSLSSPGKVLAVSLSSSPVIETDCGLPVPLANRAVKEGGGEVWNRSVSD